MVLDFAVRVVMSCSCLCREIFFGPIETSHTAAIIESPKSAGAPIAQALSAPQSPRAPPYDDSAAFTDHQHLLSPSRVPRRRDLRPPEVRSAQHVDGSARNASIGPSRDDSVITNASSAKKAAPESRVAGFPATRRPSVQYIKTQDEPWAAR